MFGGRSGTAGYSDSPAASRSSPAIAESEALALSRIGYYIDSTFLLTASVVLRHSSVGLNSIDSTSSSAS